MNRIAPVLAAVPTLAFGMPAWAQSGLGPAAGAFTETLATLAALAAVCVLAYVSLRLLRRFQVGAEGAPSKTMLRFVRALPLGPRERLVVVEWRGETLLLGVTASAVTVLDRGDLPAFDPPGPDAPGREITSAALTRALLVRVFSRRPRGNPS